jgi:hypothetical protein
MGCPPSMKNLWRDDVQLPLQILGDYPLAIKDFPQITRHGENPPLPVLRLAWIESDLAGFEIDLSPLERQDPRNLDGRESITSLRHFKGYDTFRLASYRPARRTPLTPSVRSVSDRKSKAAAGMTVWRAMARVAKELKNREP